MNTYSIQKPKLNSILNQSIPQFDCLNGEDVISAKVSDHHPVVHHGVLFWNIMMQGNIRQGSAELSYNNAFGMVETEKQYCHRLSHKVGAVIGEIINRDSSIIAISLCEGPIVISHVDIFVNSLQKQASLNKFFQNTVLKQKYNQLEIFNNAKPWGLFLWVDYRYQLQAISESRMINSELSILLSNRCQVWKMSRENHSQYLMLAHFPFAGNESVADAKKLSRLGNIFSDFVCYLLDKYSQEEFMICADFNLNPFLVSQYTDRYLDCINPNNSVILMKEKLTKQPVMNSVTVDGILLSQRVKQKYYSSNYNAGLFHRLRLKNPILTYQDKKERNSCVIAIEKPSGNIQHI